MPNADPAFVEVLAGIVQRELRSGGDVNVALATLRDDEFPAYMETRHGWYAADMVAHGGLARRRRPKAKADMEALFAGAHTATTVAGMSAPVGQRRFGPPRAAGARLRSCTIYVDERAPRARHRPRGDGLLEQEAGARGWSG